MATLQNIRNRSVLLLSVIGIAMLAFILGDFMQSQRSGSSGSVDVGEVFGEQIHIQEFEPDIILDNLPHETYMGKDAQLDAAIELLKKQISEDPRDVPKVPNYPDKSFNN